MTLRPLWVLAALALAGCDQVGSAPTSDVSKIDKSAGVSAKRQGKAIVDSQGVIFDLPGGKTGEFTFGTPRGSIEPVAARVFGAPENSRNDECGAGPMEFARYGPITLNFQDGELVGWMAREGEGVLTSDSVMPGKPMRDLKIARSARMIENSTLDGEFEYLAADGRPIRGFVEGEGRDAKIASLYAGQNCFFR